MNSSRIKILKNKRKRIKIYNKMSNNNKIKNLKKK